MITSLDLPPLSAEAIDATVDTLCELKRRSGIGLAVAIGGTLAESVYGGDLTRLRERRNDCPSLRAIAAHPRVPYSLTTLHRAIGVYDLVQRMPELPATHLTLTHLQLVLPYGNEIQRQLLVQALAEEWNTRQLEQAVRAIKPMRGKGGRPRLPQVVKTLNQLDRIASEETAWQDLDDLTPMPPEQRAALAARVVRLRRRLRGVELWLGGAEEGGGASSPAAVSGGVPDADVGSGGRAMCPRR